MGFAVLALPSSGINVTGVPVGTISSVGLILLSPKATADRDSMDGPLFPLDNPSIVSIPLGFLDTILSKEHSNEGAFDERYVRSARRRASAPRWRELRGGGEQQRQGSGRPAEAATADR